MRDVLDADPRAVLAISKLGAMSAYRKDVPPAPYFAAAIVGGVSGYGTGALMPQTANCALRAWAARAACSTARKPALEM